MKKIPILLAFCLISLSLSAQDKPTQTTTTIKVGTYQPAKYDTIKYQEPEPEPIPEPAPEPEHPHGPWYNEISLGIQYFVAANIEYPDKTFNHDGGLISFEYKRLKKEGYFLYGLGANINVLTSEKLQDTEEGKISYSSIALFLHGKVEHNGTSSLLGFNTSKLHPFASASAGVSLLSISIDATRGYYPNKYVVDYERSKLYLYLDYSIGIARDLKKSRSIALSYYAKLIPYIHGIYSAPDIKWTLTHGIEFSYRF